MYGTNDVANRGLIQGINPQTPCSQCEVNKAFKSLKDILFRLQTIALPKYSDRAKPDIYKLLRDQIAALEISLVELYSEEEIILNSQVIVTQKDINVRN